MSQQKVQSISENSSSRDGRISNDARQTNALEDSGRLREEDLKQFEHALKKTDAHERATEERLWVVGSLSLDAGYLRTMEQTPVGKAVNNSELVDLVTELVNKLWVKSGNKDGFNEIQLNLKSTLLGHTELRLSKSDGMILVQFATAAAASYQHLAAGKANLLAGLQRRFGEGNVAVDMMFMDPVSEGGDSGRIGVEKSMQARCMLWRDAEG